MTVLPGFLVRIEEIFAIVYTFDKPLLHYFPKQYDSPRPQQLEVFSHLEDEIPFEQTRFHLIDAPVGTGKSAIVATLVKGFAKIGVPSVILTPLKTLQEEYSRNFPDIPNIKGRANYACPLDPSGQKKADTAACSIEGSRCSQCKQHTVDCGYYGTRDKAISSPYFVANFRYFLLSKNTLSVQKKDPTDFHDEGDPREVLIVDEAHTLADEVLSHVNFELTPQLACGADIPSFPEAPQYADFLNSCKIDLIEKMADLREIIGNLETASRSSSSATTTANLRLYRKMESMRQKISFFLDAIDAKVEWVCESKTRKDRWGHVEAYVEFKPLRASYFIERFLFSGFKKIILLSGTFLDLKTFTRDIGISASGLSYTSIPHPFPVANRPIYYRPIADMSYKTQAAGIPLVVEQLAGALGHYAKQKGIVFTQSNVLQTAIIDGLLRKNPALRGRIVDARSENKEDMLALHCESKEPTVLFTNSMWQGIDLKDDLSRFQFILKVPYISMGDKRVKRLMEKDPEWYTMQTAKILCQSYGRSIRSATDSADTYILDMAFGNFLSRGDKFLPIWFKEAIRPA